MAHNRACMLILVQVFWLLCVGLPAVADEPGLNLIKRALLQRGDLTIRTGEFRYQLRLVEETPSNEAIEAQVELIRSGLREQLKINANDPAMLKQIRKAIDTAHEIVPPQVRENAKLLLQYYFALGGPELGGDRYLEISRFDREKDGYGDIRTLLLRSLGSGRGTSVDFDPLTRMVVVAGGRKDVYQPSQEPQRLGRAIGVLPWLVSTDDSISLDEWLSRSITDVKVTQLSGEQNVDTFKVEFKVKASESATVSMIYHIVPSLGFVTPLVREFASGKLRFEWISENYFQVEGSELWFPQSCEFRDSSLPNKEPRFEHYTFSSDGLVLNHDIPDERFRVSIPPGTPLIDGTAGKSKNYVASRAISVSIEDVADLSKLDGLTEQAEPALQNKLPLAENPRAKWLIAINVIVVLFIVWRIYKKRTNQSTTLLVMISSSLALSGCMQSPAGSAEMPDHSPIRVEPAIVDLGEVDVSLGVVNFSFDLQNVSGNDVSVKIEPGCGCTMIEKSSLLIPAGSSHRSNVSLSLRGRAGDFDNLIRITSQSVDLTALKWTIDLPVRADVFDHWRASPQRLVLERGGIGTVSVAAPVSGWDGVVAESIGRGVDFTQTSANTRGLVETRVFRVAVSTAPENFSGGNSGIGFRRSGMDGAFFTVPVLIK